MTLSELLKEFDEKFCFPKINRAETAGNCYPTASSIKSFLTQALREQREKIEKQLNMTILFNEKMVLDGYLVDWGASLRAFIKQLSKEEKNEKL